MNLTQNTKLTYLIFFKSTKPAKNAVPATKIPIIPLQIAPVPKVSVLALFPKTTTIKNINIPDIKKFKEPIKAVKAATLAIFFLKNKLIELEIEQKMIPKHKQITIIITNAENPAYSSIQ